MAWLLAAWLKLIPALAWSYYISQSCSNTTPELCMQGSSTRSLNHNAVRIHAAKLAHEKKAADHDEGAIAEAEEGIGDLPEFPPAFDCTANKTKRGKSTVGKKSKAKGTAMTSGKGEQPAMPLEGSGLPMLSHAQTREDFPMSSLGHAPLGGSHSMASVSHLQLPPMQPQPPMWPSTSAHNVFQIPAYSYHLPATNYPTHSVQAGPSTQTSGSIPTNF
ncbi:hypothetical protein BDN67DRAFT_1017740 [Paxillus ammoniavirescens]|nr:hypothetical protein BDN67DRAFT_1017740 [Paxillus ammoniavirescens]